MDLFSLDSLAHLNEPQAVRLRYDLRNTELLVWLSRVSVGVGIAHAVDPAGLPGGRLTGLVLLAVTVGTALLFGRIRRIDRGLPPKPWTRLIDLAAQPLQRRRRPLSISALILFFVLLFVLMEQPDDVVAWAIVFPWLLPLFRFTAAEFVALHGSVIGIASFRLFGLPPGLEADPLIAPVISNAFALGLGLFVTRRYRKRFLAEWSRARDRAQDQLRVRRELEYARELQLSMLPRESPDIPWLDISAFSLPAMEVGGDYYDYFPLDDGRLLVVAGDVAGHGFASGLMISGIRSCLTLLADQLDDGPEVLRRLNDMVRTTTRSRMMVSLCLVLLDEKRSEVSIASAGHPPLLHFQAASGETRPLELPALPLGSKLQKRYPDTSLPLEPGDVLLLYTDGLFEATNESDEPYGFDRLQDLVTRLAPRSNAAEIREGVLKDIWSFKGERLQEDDITVVALKVRESST